MTAFPVPAGSVIFVPGGVDNTLPGGGGGSIDNSLPGGGFIDNSLPPPPGIWPPPVTLWPPVALPPDYPMPPGSIWPPVRPPHAGAPLPIAPGHPDAGLPPAPALPDAGLPVPPGHAPSGKFLVAIVAMAAGGLRVVGYTVVDPSLAIGYPPVEPVPAPKG